MEQVLEEAGCSRAATCSQHGGIASPASHLSAEVTKAPGKPPGEARAAQSCSRAAGVALPFRATTQTGDHTRL